MKKNWIRKIMINSWINKKDLQKIDIQSFFNNYSLHDSVLINFYINGTDETILLFQIDPFWSEEFKKYQSGELKDWPYVLIKFSGVKTIKTEFKNHSMEIGFSGISIIYKDMDVIVNLIGTHGDNYEIISSNQVQYSCFNKYFKKIKLNNVEEI